MQTFLPYPGFEESARCLDNKRLGKQRVETLQILKALTDPEYGWKNHPATRMWEGYTEALAMYGLAICKEWIERGFQDSCAGQIAEFVHEDTYRAYVQGVITLPPWIGDPDFHRSHRSNLLRKDPKWYGQFEWLDPDDLDYFWPTKEGYFAQQQR